jgi:aminoglycoside phosphotransferase (APT) family kinase protein
VLAANPPAPLDERRRTVVHDDLYARHVLLDRSMEQAGIIDRGDMHLGNPALDIAIAHRLLPANAHDAFRSAYGPIDERTWRAASRADRGGLTPARVHRRRTS